MNNKMKKVSRREREKALHRQEIMDAAIKVFSKKGFDSATLDEVAQEAEFSKGALYLYFSNKEDILFNILDNAFGGWAEFFDATITGGRKLNEELPALFNGVAERIFEHPELFPLVSAQQSSHFKNLSEEKRADVIKKHNYIWANLKLRVDKAIEDNELRNIKPEAIVGIIHGSMEAMIHNRWHCQSLDELKKAINNIMDIIFYGIDSRKEPTK